MLIGVLCPAVTRLAFFALLALLAFFALIAWPRPEEYLEASHPEVSAEHHRYRQASALAPA